VSSADKILSLELDLEPEQRIHLNILIQARQDFATARALEYIDEAGLVDESAFRFKGRGTRLVGGFSIPMNVNSLYELSEYWRSDAPAKSLAQLNIPEMGQRDFLSRLNNAVQYREAKPSKMQLDTL
tara:strand:+ start:335 stop:715 length:381 start_codon:yes stop_codon:yes gene_type:complete